VIANGLGELPRRAAIGNQSPVYFLLPWLSVQLFGLNEVAVRLPSLLAGTALAPAVFALARRWSGSTAAGLVAATLAVIDPTFIYFSGEARAYACVQLVAVLQVGVFCSLLQRDTWKRRAGWICLSALLFYLHYTAILLVAAQAAFLLAMAPFSRWKPAYSLKRFACDAGVLAALMLPAAGHLREIAGRRENWTLFVHAPTGPGDWQIFPIAACLLTPALLAYGYILLRRWRGNARPLSALWPQLAPMVFCLLWLFVPLAIVYLTARLGIAALWMERYVIASAASVALLAGLLCAVPASKALRAALAAATLAVALFWIGPQWRWLEHGRFSRARGENWRQAVAYINTNEQADDWPILLRSALIEADGLLATGKDRAENAALRDYSLLPIRSIYSVGAQRLAIPLASSRPGEIDAVDLRRLEAHDGLWLMTRGGPENAERTVKQVLRRLHRHGLRPQKSTTHNFGRVWVVRIDFANVDD